MTRGSTPKTSSLNSTITMTDEHACQALTQYLNSMSFINDNQYVYDLDLDADFKVMAFIKERE